MRKVQCGKCDSILDASLLDYSTTAETVRYYLDEDEFEKAAEVLAADVKKEIKAYAKKLGASGGQKLVVTYTKIFIEQFAKAMRKN